MNPGDRVTQGIRLVRLLGQGGMGSVWLAEHERLKTEVVVKFIVGEYANQPEIVARFEREATLAAQAKSPHVVQIFDHGIAESGFPYIAMEYLAGEDLASRIEREGKIQPTVFAEWFRQACAGLHRAHSKGIVHRDLKPENIFLCDEDGEVLVKILDFGIAKGDANDTNFSGTKTGSFLGTAYYMSPEQTLGAKGIDLRTDLWAMGVVAYLALTGKRPFDGDAIGALVMAINSAEPLAPSSLENLPVSFDEWTKKALAKKPEDRFQSAREMASSLVEALTGRSLSVGADFGPMSGAARDSHASAHSGRDATLQPFAETVAHIPTKKGVSPFVWIGGAGAVALGALSFALFGRSGEAPPPVEAASVPSIEPKVTPPSPVPANEAAKEVASAEPPPAPVEETPAEVTQATSRPTSVDPAKKARADHKPTAAKATVQDSSAPARAPAPAKKSLQMEIQ